MHVTEMKMPSSFVSLGVDEMEYDGQGWLGNLFKKASTILKCVAIVCAAAACAVVAFGGSLFVGACLITYAKVINGASGALGFGSSFC